MSVGVSKLMMRWMHQARSTLSRSGRPVLCFLGLLLAVRVIGLSLRSPVALQFPDTYSYLDISALGPFSWSFWTSPRPPGLPLFMWFLANNTRAIVVAQTVIYIGAFVWLADHLLQRARFRIAGWSLALAVMAIAAQPRFALWNADLLSESLSIGLGVAAITAWLKWSDQPAAPRFARAAMITLAWFSIRDAHIAPLVVVMAVMLVTAWRHTDRDMRRQLMRWTSVCAFVVAFTLYSQNSSDRNQYGLMNNVGVRILPDATMTERFIARGMPDSAALRERTGKNAWDQGAMLESPELEEFRQWVRGSGQTDQVVSYVRDAPFWWSIFSRDLNSSLAYDFIDYDRFGVSGRTLDPLAVVGGPSNNGQALLVGAIVVAAVAWAIRRRAYRQACIIGTLAIATIVDLYVSVVSDASEVQRHLVGPMSRVALLLILAVAALIGTKPAVSENTGVHQRKAETTPLPWVPSIVAGVSGVFVLIALLALEFRTQDWDPAFARTIIDRVAVFGGTYYDNGIWHHGPFDAWLYDIARFVTTPTTYWFAIAALVLVISVVVAASASAVARVFGASRAMAALIFAVVVVHFSVSSSDYAGVIYSRNATTMVLSIAFALIAWPRWWTTRASATQTFVVVAMLLGLSVQTMVSSALPVAVIGLALVGIRGSMTGFRFPWLVGASVSAATVASAPLWYALRGSLNEFWQNWWVMGGYMNSATGQSLGTQFGKGWDVLFEYYRERPALLGAVITALVTVWAAARDTARPGHGLRLALVGWFVASWIEMWVSQRFSSHYYSVVAVPTLLLLASTAPYFWGNIKELLGRRAETLWRSKIAYRAVFSAVVSVLVVMQTHDLTLAGTEAVARFRGTGAHAQFVRDTRSGESKTLRAVLDLVSTKQDPLLAWTMFPWTYLEFERVSATRFSWKSFMIGEIYLASTSPKYVLKDTWKWFDQDIAEAKPQVFVHPIEIKWTEGTPFETYVNNNFVKVYTTPVFHASIERARWAAMMSLTNDTVVATEEIVADTDAWSDETSIMRGESAQPMQVLDRSCQSFSLQATTAIAGERPSLRFTMKSQARPDKTWSIVVDGQRAQALAGDALIHESPTVLRDGASVRLLVGAQSAAVVVDGVIVSAVSIDDDVTTSLTLDTDATEITNLRRGAADMLEGCADITP